MPVRILAVHRTIGIICEKGLFELHPDPDDGRASVIGLTPQGLQRVPRVLELVFATARVLREQGLPSHLFKERQTLARLDERYRDRGGPKASSSGRK